MSAPAAAGWIRRVRAAAPGAELLGFLTRRFSAPYEEGPRLNDRRGEGVEDVFVELTEEDEAFRDRLDETIAGYFHSDADPADGAAHPVIRGLLGLVGTLSLGISGARVRAWLSRHEATLRAEPDAVLGRAALDAIATTKVSGTADGRNFWLQLWRSGPATWQARAFVGLRLQDPRAAAEELPELLRRAETQVPGPGPLLLGMWKQPEGRTALVAWLRTTQNQETADKVRRVLRALVSPQDQADLDKPQDQADLDKPKPRYRLRSLGAPAPCAWAGP